MAAVDIFIRLTSLFVIAAALTAANASRTNADEFESSLGDMIASDEITSRQHETPDFELVRHRVDCDRADCYQESRLDQLSFLAAIDGAKQPQDYGVNADLGIRLRVNYSAPLAESYGLGYQVGTAVNWTDNAVRVFEVLGEDTSRFQSYTTFGLFQRLDGWGWGAVYDHLYQDGFDKTTLGQFRGQVSRDVTANTQIGLMGRLRAFDDTANFLGTPVTLRSINQGSVYFRHFFETGVQSTWWLGLVDEHGESNAVTGASPARDESFVIGADFYAPLNDSLALYGETNLITPADTGTVDAFFGMVWYPFNNAKRANRARFSPMQPVAAATSFAVDLVP